MKLLGVLLVCACGSESRPPSPEPAPVRRVIEPPTGAVKLLAPHSITADGVGPYKLRKPVAPLLDRSQAGAPNTRFEIPNLLHSSLSRTEQGGLLIGSELAAGSGTTITFLAVISPHVGTLSSGVRVGSSKDDAIKAGVVSVEVDRAFDPRLLVPAVAPDARLIVERDRVAAIVLGPPRDRPARRSADECTRLTPPNERSIGACMTTGELIEIEGEDVIIRLPDQEKPLARTPIPNLTFAAPLRGPEGRDELIAIARADEPTTKTWMLVAFRFEGGQLRRATDPTPLYQLSSTQARWIGAELSDLDLVLEVAAARDSIEVGGLLTSTRRGELHDVLTISPVTVARKHVKPATPEAVDAGAPDPEGSNGSGERSGSARAR